jgi:hypothetical protein
MKRTAMDINSPKADLLADLGEVVIDRLLENEVLKEIPILGSAVNLARAGIGIRERVFLNKIKIFVSLLPEQSEEDRQRFVDELEKDSKSRIRFGETVLTVIEQSDSTVKVEYVAIVFSAFLKGYISPRELRELCHSISMAQADNLIEFAETEKLSERQIRQLVHTGLTAVRYPPVELTFSGSIDVKPKFGISKIGGVLRNLIRDFSRANKANAADARTSRG